MSRRYRFVWTENDLKSGPRIHNTLVPLLKPHAVEDPIVKLLNENPWLKDFDAKNEFVGFSPSQGVYDNDSNQMTMKLLEFIEKYASTIQVTCLQVEDLAKFLNDYVVEQNGLSSLQHFCQKLRMFRWQLHSVPAWQGLCQRVTSFCLSVGCPVVDLHDPIGTVNNLRQHKASQMSSIRERALQDQINRLEATSARQQRIITNLTFRHVLETLPGPRPKYTSSTKHWQTFWTNAIQNARNPKNMSTAIHPLQSLLQQFNPRDIERVSGDLYGTLSTNIHHYSGEFDVKDSQ